jgi:amino acid transporter
MTRQLIWREGIANAIIAGVGAILMLVSLALPWYAYRTGRYSVNVSPSDLLSHRLAESNWAGSGLPLVFVIILAVAILLCTVTSLVTRKTLARVWGMLGLLALMSVVANALYILWWFHGSQPGEEWINIVHAGSIIAFIGALTVMVSCFVRWRRQPLHPSCAL